MKRAAIKNYYCLKDRFPIETPLFTSVREPKFGQSQVGLVDYLIEVGRLPAQLVYPKTTPVSGSGWETHSTTKNQSSSLLAILNEVPSLSISSLFKTISLPIPPRTM